MDQVLVSTVALVEVGEVDAAEINHINYHIKRLQCVQVLLG